MYTLKERQIISGGDITLIDKLTADGVIEPDTAKNFVDEVKKIYIK
jgi:polyhydroxyalkanoate synthesis regulator phasin